MTDTQTIPAPRGGPAPDWGMNYGIDSLWSEIIPGTLWMGGTADDDWMDSPRFARTDKQGNVQNLAPAQVTKDDIDAVVTLFEWARPVGHKVRELRVGIYDAEGADTFDLDELHEMVDWAVDHIKAGRRVLVRCQAGMNRSGLITALILIALGMEAREAVAGVRAKRSKQALFNKSFVTFVLKQKTEDWA